MLVGILLLAQSSFSSIDAVSSSWKEMGERAGEIRRTELGVVEATTQDGGALVDITLRNEGQKALSSYALWDVVMQYYDGGGSYHIQWLPYIEGTLGDNEWTVEGMYLDAMAETPEVFEPGILNPEEEMVVRISLEPPIGSGTTNWVAISTFNGVVTWATVIR